MVKTFLKIYDHFRRNTRSLYVLLALCVAITAGGLFLVHFDEDVSGFLTAGKDQERIGYAYRNMDGASKIIINISMADEQAAVDRDLLTTAVDHLARLLEEGPAREHIEKITYRVDPSLMMEVSTHVTANMPYYLQEEDYARIDSLLRPDVMDKGSDR